MMTKQIPHLRQRNAALGQSAGVLVPQIVPPQIDLLQSSTRLRRRPSDPFRPLPPARLGVMPCARRIVPFQALLPPLRRGNTTSSVTNRKTTAGDPPGLGHRDRAPVGVAASLYRSYPSDNTVQAVLAERDNCSPTRIRSKVLHRQATRSFRIDTAPYPAHVSTLLTRRRTRSAVVHFEPR